MRNTKLKITQSGINPPLRLTVWAFPYTMCVFFCRQMLNVTHSTVVWGPLNIFSACIGDSVDVFIPSFLCTWTDNLWCWSFLKKPKHMHNIFPISFLISHLSHFFFYSKSPLSKVQFYYFHLPLVHFCFFPFFCIKRVKNTHKK